MKIPKAIKKSVVKKILAQIINHNGSTHDPLLNKDYNGTPNIAIAPFPERSQVFIGELTREMIAGYCHKNNDLFQKHFALGVWFEKNTKKTYLDVVVPIPLEKQSEALKLGRSANQIAGFNLLDFSEIQIGGTGEFNSSVYSFDERFKNALALIK